MPKTRRSVSLQSIFAPLVAYGSAPPSPSASALSTPPTSPTRARGATFSSPSRTHRHAPPALPLPPAIPLPATPASGHSPPADLLDADPFADLTTSPVLLSPSTSLPRSPIRGRPPPLDLSLAGPARGAPPVRSPLARDAEEDDAEDTAGRWPPADLLDANPFADLASRASPTAPPRSRPPPLDLSLAGPRGAPPVRSPLARDAEVDAEPPAVVVQPRPRSSSGNSAFLRPAFGPRPSLPSLSALARESGAIPKVRRGHVGAQLPAEPWARAPPPSPVSPREPRARHVRRPTLSMIRDSRVVLADAAMDEDGYAEDVVVETILVSGDEPETAITPSADGWFAHGSFAEPIVVNREEADFAITTSADDIAPAPSPNSYRCSALSAEDSAMFPLRISRGDERAAAITMSTDDSALAPSSPSYRASAERIIVSSNEPDLEATTAHIAFTSSSDSHRSSALSSESEGSSALLVRTSRSSSISPLPSLCASSPSGSSTFSADAASLPALSVSFARARLSAIDSKALAAGLEYDYGAALARLTRSPSPGGIVGSLVPEAQAYFAMRQRGSMVEGAWEPGTSAETVKPRLRAPGPLEDEDGGRSRTSSGASSDYGEELAPEGGLACPDADKDIELSWALHGRGVSFFDGFGDGEELELSDGDEPLLARRPGSGSTAGIDPGSRGGAQRGAGARHIVAPGRRGRRRSGSSSSSSTSSSGSRYSTGSREWVSDGPSVLDLSMTITRHAAPADGGEGTRHYRSGSGTVPGGYASGSSSGSNYSGSSGHGGARGGGAGGGMAGGAGGGGDDGDGDDWRRHRPSASVSTTATSETERPEDEDSEDDESEGETDSSSADYVTALDFGGDETDTSAAARRASRRLSRLARAPPVPALPTPLSPGAADDVPLAQVIPSALSAQRTIRRQVRDEIDQMRAERRSRHEQEERGQATPPASARSLPEGLPFPPAPPVPPPAQTTPPRRTSEAQSRPQPQRKLSTPPAPVPIPSPVTSTVPLAAPPPAYPARAPSKAKAKAPSTGVVTPSAMGELTRKLMNIQASSVFPSALHRKRPSVDLHPKALAKPPRAPVQHAPSTSSQGYSADVDKDRTVRRQPSRVAPFEEPQEPALRRQPSRATVAPADEHGLRRQPSRAAVADSSGDERGRSALRPQRSFHRSQTPAAESRSAGPSGSSSVGRSKSLARGRAASESVPAVPPLPPSASPRMPEHQPAGLDRGRSIKAASRRGSPERARSSAERERDQRRERSQVRKASAEQGPASAIPPPPAPYVASHAAQTSLSQPPPYQPKAVTMWQQRIFIGNLQSFCLVEIGASTTAGDILQMVDAQGGLEQGGSGGGWMVWEVSQDFGMERPVRSFESLADVCGSWNTDKIVNFLVIKRTFLANMLSRSALPTSSPMFGGFVQHEYKRGKWQKRYLELREHSLWLSKRESGKDQVFLCSLNNFDAYTFMRPRKAPKQFVFAVKSTDSVSYFESISDYVHVFSCAEGEGRTWIEKILVARSYIMYQERNVLSSSGLSRMPTRAGQRPAQPLINVPQKHEYNGGSNAAFEPGSLLARR